jgi:small subunit ribosomal protein S16
LLRIRLSRHGAKKDPHYRVVVTDRRSPRDGRFVEIVGYYNPALRPVRLHLDLERVDYWVGQGAQPSATVQSLMNRVRKESEPEPEAQEA